MKAGVIYSLVLLDTGCIILLESTELSFLHGMVKRIWGLIPIRNSNGHTGRLRVCPMQLIHFWSRDVHPFQNLLLCTKFHQNPMIFHWDMAIYQCSKWRPSAILELFYHNTRPPTKSLLLAIAASQISCESDTQIWRYSYGCVVLFTGWFHRCIRLAPDCC